MKVELIYDPDCPNVGSARSALIEAFSRTGVSARWREWERGAPEAPSYACAFGSPTILVDGKDIAGAVPGADAPSCRVYRAEDGTRGRAPSLDALCAALLASAKPGGFRAVVASLPAIGGALLPKLTCPLCWPAYAAVLGTLGVEFVNYTPYLFPATLVFLALAVGALALAARRSGRLTPVSIGLVAAGIVLIGKFAMESDWVTNGGIALLVAAIFLSTRMRAARVPPCPACVEEGQPESR